MTNRSVQFVLVVLATLLHFSQPQCFSEKDGPLLADEGSHQSLLQSQLQFSADLLQKVSLMQPGDNVFLSPLSVYHALLLAYLVSAKQTETSLRKLLRIQDDQDKMAVFGAYSLEKYKQGVRSVRGSGRYHLSSASRMFVSTEEQLRPCISKLFKGELELADFKNNASAVVARVNDWVDGQTRDNIKDLLSPDTLNSNTNLVLVNAAYFQGFWKSKFSPEETREAKFTVSNGTKVPVNLMSLESKFSHITDEDLSAEVLELPYEGDDISMYIMLPLQESLTAITDLLNKTNAEKIQQVVKNLSKTPEDVSVVIPKFTIDLTLELKNVLESMGVGDLFQSSADLSVLTGSPGITLDSAIHKAKVTVDETGTVAAAATAFFANRFAGDSFVADHPFVYFLFDKKNSVLLFAGVFNSPNT